MSKKALAMLTAELVGTFVLTMIILSINRYGLPIFSAAAAAVVMTTMYAAVGGVSGGHFNPAVTLGIFSLRKISFAKAVGFVAAQVVGAVLAWKLYEYFTDKSLRLLTPEFDWKIFTAELIGTMIFTFAIAAVVYRKFDGYYAAVTIGAGLFIGASIGSMVALGGIINPAVAIGLGYRPENIGYIAYFFGPVIGAIIGMNFYKYAFTDQTVSFAAVSKTGKLVSRDSSSPLKKIAPEMRPTAKKKTATKKKTTKRSTKK